MLAVTTALLQVATLLGSLLVGRTVSVVHAEDIQVQLQILAAGVDRTQIHYRWRNDDGTEASASFGAAEDAATTTVALGDRKRLRIEISNEGSSSTSDEYLLQYSASADCSSGTWTKVEDASGCTGPFCLAAAQLSDGAATTNVASGLTDENSSFIVGTQQEDAATTTHVSLETINFTEFEYSLQATTQAAEGTAYYFRMAVVSGGNAAVLDGYDVCPSLITQTPTPTPAVTPTPTPTPGGGAAGPPTPISPQQHPDPFVANEDTVAPYVYVGMLDGTVISPGEVGTTYAFNPLVTGKTNLRDAVIFIEVSDFPGVFYTTHANVRGAWEFTVPQPLAYGFHHLQITAVSPIDPTLRAGATFWFQVVQIPLVPPGPPPGVPPAISPPVPAVPPSTLPVTTVPPSAELYDLRIEVPPSSAVVIPPSTLEVNTYITPLAPPPAGEELTTLVYRILDGSGQTVAREERQVLLGEPATIPITFRQPARLAPGEYVVQVELQRGEVTYIASDRFRVATPTVTLLPGIIVEVAATADVLQRLSFWFSLLLLSFLLLLWAEYRHCRRQTGVNERDLWRDGDIR